jgi:glycosyltransferase involved in cell wall biosynthesis
VTPPLVEVRVPTFNRPHLLRRALESLSLQTYDAWTCLVFDDSPLREGEKVVKALNDSRIQYLPNKVNLGCARNLDRAFQTRAYCGGEFACVLEDDNVYLPEFLESNLCSLQATGLNLLQRNQATWFQSAEGDYSDTGRTTLAGNWSEGEVSVISMKAMLFCGIPISNGGFFWRCSATSNLQVGQAISDGGLQEYLRTYQIVEPIQCSMRPLAKYTTMELTTRGGLPYRQAARVMQRLREQLYKEYGQELIEAIHSYAAVNPSAQPKKWLAQDLMQPRTVPGLAYAMKGLLIRTRGHSSYLKYFEESVRDASQTILEGCHNRPVC